MLNRKFLGIVASTFMFVSLMMLVGNSAYAEKEPKGPELPEALGLPICPTCENVVPAKHTKGRVTAPLVMNCPDCKEEIVEFGVYHCDRCEKEFLACIKCLGKYTKAATRCPECKKVLARQIKGKIGAHVKWEMKCPDCKKKPDEWLIQHCDKCEVDFLACPLCKIR
jgi:phage FluMu protein Com